MKRARSCADARGAADSRGEGLVHGNRRGGDSTGVQVHGGMGYVEETGAAQFLRDVRIASIYEGTTGIQANDLIGRKLGRDRGAAMASLIQDLLAEARTPRARCSRAHKAARNAATEAPDHVARRHGGRAAHACGRAGTRAGRVGALSEAVRCWYRRRADGARPQRWPKPRW